VIWFRAALVAVLTGVVVVALTQAAPKDAVDMLPTPTVEPTPRPTSVPLPTLVPAAIVSRISRATPAPPVRPTPSAQPLVELVDYAFSPGQLTIHLGTSVEFVNDGNDGHDVTGTGPGGDWRSGPLAPSERYSRSFSLVGTYDYACTIHPEMRGRVVVQP
jgi:plastocyanin